MSGSRTGSDGERERLTEGEGVEDVHEDRDDVEVDGFIQAGNTDAGTDGVVELTEPRERIGSGSANWILGIMVGGKPIGVAGKPP